MVAQLVEPLRFDICLQLTDRLHLDKQKIVTLFNFTAEGKFFPQTQPQK